MGLHHNRFLYYDPDIGRFVSQDPIGLLGGKIFNSLGFLQPVGFLQPAQSILCTHALEKCMELNFFKNEKCLVYGLLATNFVFYFMWIK
ncbi:hypothetical protein FM069_09570 [Pseudomonas mangiferae]|uniref:RHS repeat-associated core domain-containing protein n=1 Tax=Pseudomonas mangiferae TaxID=2593654 RepID=A0A553GZ50_9PSED|nr:hypothetical protein FM069_09570 [Pseudomonas mangiferae]